MYCSQVLSSPGGREHSTWWLRSMPAPRHWSATSTFRFCTAELSRSPISPVGDTGRARWWNLFTCAATDRNLDTPVIDV